MSDSKSSVKRLAALEKQRQALELRKAGATFEEIAQRLGYSHHTGAYNAVKVAMQRTIQQPADELRALESARLDRLLLGIYQDAARGNVQKIDRVLKIMARRAALLGLDAPTKTEDVTNYRAEAEKIAAEIGKPELVDAIEADMQRDRLVSQEPGR